MGNILAFKEVSTREFASQGGALGGKSCLTGTFSLNLEYGGNKNNDSTQKNDSTGVGCNAHRRWLRQFTNSPTVC